MIGRRNFTDCLLLGAALLALGSCGVDEPEQTFRYRMTVEVETPSGVRIGSAVRELKYFDGGGGPSIGESRPQVKLVGEAIAIDLPGGQTLFALLTGADGDVDYATRIVDRSGLWNLDKPKPEGTVISLYPTAPDTSGLANTSPTPMLVTFKDIKNPASLEGVDSGDLEVSFGGGYRLKSVSVQAANAPLTIEIMKRLPWLDNAKVMENPGWGQLPLATRIAINGLYSGTRSEK